MWVLESATRESESWLYHPLSRLLHFSSVNNSPAWFWVLSEVRLEIVMCPIICDSSSCLLLPSVQMLQHHTADRKQVSTIIKEETPQSPPQAYRSELDLIFEREDNRDVERKRELTQSLMLTTDRVVIVSFCWVELSYLCFPRINYYLKNILLNNNHTLLLKHKYGLPSWLTD